MKKNIRIIIILCVCTLFVIVFCCFRYNAMSAEVVNIQIEQVADESTIHDVYGASEEYIKKFRDSPQDFYIVQLIFNVRNNCFISCGNWKVSIKNYDDSYEIFYNVYKGEGSDYTVDAKASVEHLGMRVLVYKKNASAENIEQFANEKLSLQAVCYPCFFNHCFSLYKTGQWYLTKK